MSEVILSCRNVSKNYHQGSDDIQVLRGINFTIYKGETVAIIGASGAGKSTLLNLLGGLDDCSEGEVELAGNILAQLKEKKLSQLRNRSLGFVYQQHHLLSEFDAVENVAMPLLIRGVKKTAAINKAKTLLDKVGLAHRYYHRPQSLSGGERQRVAIARALVGEPACVLMDEPTGNLDEHTAEQIQHLLSELNRDLAISFVVVTHDKQIAAKQQRCLLLKDGELSEGEAIA